MSWKKVDWLIKMDIYSKLLLEYRWFCIMYKHRSDKLVDLLWQLTDDKRKCHNLSAIIKFKEDRYSHGFVIS